MVERTGLAQNFHFLLRKDKPNFEITPGDYTIEIYGRALNSRNEKKPCETNVLVSKNLIAEGAKVDIQFDWAPDTKAYVGHVAPSNFPDQLEVKMLLQGLAAIPNTPKGNNKP